MPTGKSITDLEYAKFAQLYELTTLSGARNSLVVMAKFLDLPRSTVQERVREARRRGLLTQPGVGVRTNTYMTKKAKELVNASTRGQDNNE